MDYDTKGETMDYGLWAMGYGLWTMDYRLWTMDYDTKRDPYAWTQYGPCMDPFLDPLWTPYGPFMDPLRTCVWSNRTP